MNTRRRDPTQLLADVRAYVEDFEAGRIDPLEVPASPVRTASTPKLDEIEQALFGADADAAMDDHDRGVLRRQWGAFRLARHVVSDDLDSLQWALSMVAGRAIDHGDQLRLKVLFEMLDPKHRPAVTH